MRGGSTVRMHIGACVVTLHLEASRSLKDKRQVIRSLMERTRLKFNVAIAEVDDLDLWQRATLGITTVSNDSAHANRVLDKVLDHLESHPEFTIGAVNLEML